MMKKLMNKKRNNKGFSLVELIVVVLIIAIIAVALAPQVMKWVGTSRTNVDASNAATIKSAASAGIAEYLGTAGASITAAVSYTVDGTDGELDHLSGTDIDDLEAIIEEILNEDFPVKQSDGTNFTIVISDTGSVEVN